jgi:hypothetical protein
VLRRQGRIRNKENLRQSEDWLCSNEDSGEAYFRTEDSDVRPGYYDNPSGGSNTGSGGHSKAQRKAALYSTKHLINSLGCLMHY